MLGLLDDIREDTESSTVLNGIVSCGEYLAVLVDAQNSYNSQLLKLGF